MKKQKSNVIDFAAARRAANRRVRCLTIRLEDAQRNAFEPCQFFRYHTYERRETDGQVGYFVYGWRTRPDHKALRAQDLNRNLVGRFASSEASKEAFSRAVFIARGRRLILRGTFWDEYEELGTHWSVGSFHRLTRRIDTD